MVVFVRQPVRKKKGKEIFREKDYREEETIRVIVRRDVKFKEALFGLDNHSFSGGVVSTSRSMLEEISKLKN
jgi:hypothetical protein